MFMVVDFHQHFTPMALRKQDPGDRLILTYDEIGAPSYTNHRLLYDIDAHVAMMDACGIDLAMLSSASAMDADLERSRLVNDACHQMEQSHPGRFCGLAHANARGGQAAFDEMKRCAEEYGFPGVCITSEMEGAWLDNLELEPFWTAAERPGMFVFIHPALKLAYSQQFDAYDLARSVGREFSLVMATIRLINCGVFDRHPGLVVQMSHLGGGISSVIARVRSYQDKVFWGTAGNARHGALPEKDFDHYIAKNLVFDTGGFCGAIEAVEMALIEIPVARIVFGTDYPQEIRSNAVCGGFVKAIRSLGANGEAILEGNAKALLK
jgi:predicted TIM-barrel fold metal-dependent hydrolase